MVRDGRPSPKPNRQAAASGRKRLRKAAKGLVLLEVGPGGQRSLAQRETGIADQQRGVGPLLHAQPLARRAPAQRAVEREVMRVERLEPLAALLARKVLAEPL